jgi:N-acyl homoserine lactone hydrolase
MTTYTITALLVGKVTRDRHYEKTHDNPDIGKLVTRPVYVFLVQGPDPDDLTVINAGCPSVADGKQAWAPIEFDQPLPEGGGPQSIVDALASVGRTPDDVKRLIMTHLHIEDAWNTALFPNAQLVVQRDEVEAAFSPPSWQRLLYPHHAALDVQSRKKPERCLMLWDDKEIADGLVVLKTPGFTMGTQTPVINTERGRVAITAAGGTYANWFPNDPRFGYPLRPMAETVNIPGNYVMHPWDVTHNMERIRQSADIVVPIHDENIPKIMPDMWWACPDDAEVDRHKGFAEMPFAAGTYLGG